MSVDDAVREGGKRRIDRVLSEDYLAGIGEVAMSELRALRDEAEQEEVDLSYLRRMLQGRLDLVVAEQARRKGGSSEHVVDDLAHVLSDSAPRGTAFGMGRHSTKEPSRAGETRRMVEALVADASHSDVENQTDEELATFADRLRTEEAKISARRRAVQEVFDACSAEVTRRYRDGEAAVDDLLPGEPPTGG